MNKKVKKEVFDRMPLDCWGNVIIYFSHHGDFMTLVLVVKGLWHYVNVIAPPSTRNVEFRLKNIPRNGKYFVTNLIFSPKLDTIEEEEDKDDFDLLLPERRRERIFNRRNREKTSNMLSLQRWKSYRIGDFLEKILQVFTNLISLDCNFTNFAFGGKWRKILFGNSLESHTHLNELILQVPEKSNAIFSPPKLPFLSSLEIYRKCFIYDEVYEDEVADLEFRKLENIPQLRRLYLSCWSMKTSFWEIKTKLLKLETMGLFHVTPLETKINKFKSLRSLELLGCSVCTYQSIRNCERLERLVFSENTPMENVKYTSFQHSSSFVSKNVSIGVLGFLPSLKTLHFEIINCPFVSNVVISSISFPSLETLHLEIAYRRINHGKIRSLHHELAYRRNNSGSFSINHGKIRSLHIDCIDTKVEIVNVMGIRNLRFRGKSIPIELERTILSSTSKNQLENIDLECTNKKLLDGEENKISFIGFQKLQNIRFRGLLCVEKIIDCPSLTKIDVFNKTIRIQYNNLNNRTISYRRIELLSKLKSLKCIRVVDKEYNRHPFMKKISVIDCDKIEVIWNNFEVKDRGFQLKKFTLREYVSVMKEKGVKIQCFQDF